jgi:hypothetical protein
MYWVRAILRTYTEKRLRKVAKQTLRIDGGMDCISEFILEKIAVL